MNALELMERLDEVGDTTVPSFVVITDGAFVRYGIDSVADDGTFIVVPIGTVDLEVRTTEGNTDGSSGTDRLYAVQDDGEEDGVVGD